MYGAAGWPTGSEQLCQQVRRYLLCRWADLHGGEGDVAEMEARALSLLVLMAACMWASACRRARLEAWEQRACWANFLFFRLLARNNKEFQIRGTLLAVGPARAPAGVCSKRAREREGLLQGTWERLLLTNWSEAERCIWLRLADWRRSSKGFVARG